MAVMPKVSQEALDYLKSWGIDTHCIIEGSLTRDGYEFLAPGDPYSEPSERQWPSGFNWDHLREIYYEKPDAGLTDFARAVRKELTELGDFLIAKNEAYGNSALDPVRIFSRASTEEQLLVRIDDKLSRLQRGHEYADDDTVQDLCGYLVLLMMARNEQG